MSKLSKKQERKLLQDTTDMIVLVLAYGEYIKSIDKEKEAKAFVQNYVKNAREKALEDMKKKVS